MIIDLFGSHSRYARRNQNSVVKAELEAVSGPERAGGHYGNMNLQNLFSRPVVKRGAETKVKVETGSDIGRNIVHMLPVGLTVIKTMTKCEGDICRRVHVRKA